MVDNEKLIEAAKLLKEYCRSKSCGNCMFSTRDICIFDTGGTPTCWEIPKPRRWTDADVAMAKALKAFGVVSVYRSVNGHGVMWGMNDQEYEGGLPDGAFASLEPAESVMLDEIIEEGENHGDH